jgi:hypothetical protein
VNDGLFLVALVAPDSLGETLEWLTSAPSICVSILVFPLRATPRRDRRAPHSWLLGAREASGRNVHLVARSRGGTVAWREEGNLKRQGLERGQSYALGV